MYKMCYFVPESHLETTKSALFEVGAGRIGDYDCCAWQCKGQGQFRPLDGSQPFWARPGKLSGWTNSALSWCARTTLLRRQFER